MKTLYIILFFFTATMASAFQWPGGTMSVPYVFRGDEVFAGWVPSSPWGSAVFLYNPVVELRNANGDVVAEHTATGGTMDWYLGARRSGVATFTVPAGEYSVTGRDGRRLVRISGEGYSGFRLWVDSIQEPAGVIPPNRPPTIAWVSVPAVVAHQESYSVVARGTDEDGNLAQVTVWKNGAAFAAGNGPDVGNATSDGGPQTISFSAQAVDSAGAASGIITASVTIEAPVPVNFRLTASAGPGGSVVGGGMFAAGSQAAVTAIPDAQHDFVGWSGDAAGSVGAISVLMDRDKGVQATFGLKTFTLSTSATAGGNVTPGGTYPFGSMVTVSAVPEATHYFAGWSGDASGVTPLASVWLDRAKVVQAVFVPKASQTISFGALADQGVGQDLTLAATASSGLPVAFEIVQGAVNLSDDRLTILGPGPVSVRAVQAGDAYHLPATPVVRTFNAAGAARVRVQSVARTLLDTGRTAGSVNYVLGTP